ncbi:MAG: hypothetical protein Fur0037_23240 [Planctomycetota bacterium]
MSDLLRVFVPAILSLCLVSGGPARAQQGLFGDPIAGQRLFSEKDCVQCHGVRGAGGTIGSDLGRKSSGSSFYEIAAAMWNHSPGMTGKMAEYRIAHPQLEGEELSNLISFLYFLNYFDEPGDARAGMVLFNEKHCIRCHKVGDEGGTAGPSLDATTRANSPLELAASLWNHGPAMMKALKDAGLAVPKFAGNDIIDLYAFIRSHKRRTSAQRFQSPGDPRRGEELFATKGCAGCHAVFAAEPAIGPDLGRAELRGSVTQIAGRMWNHWPEMARRMEQAGMTPPQFDVGELLDLFAYVYIARYEGPRRDPSRGRRVFDGKGCAICHGKNGEGKVGPSLHKWEGKSVAEIAQAMWNHAPKMKEHLREQTLSWAPLEADELADLLAFLASGFGQGGFGGK